MGTDSIHQVSVMCQTFWHECF